MNTVYPGAIRQTADALAAFLNAGGNDLVFVDNATTGCNAVLRSLSFRSGDDVLLLSHAYGRGPQRRPLRDRTSRRAHRRGQDPVSRPYRGRPRRRGRRRDHAPVPGLP